MPSCSRPVDTGTNRPLSGGRQHKHALASDEQPGGLGSYDADAQQVHVRLYLAWAKSYARALSLHHGGIYPGIDVNAMLNLFRLRAHTNAPQPCSD
eukprot:242424-Chlamydomonas_euryale.AAC.5